MDRQYTVDITGTGSELQGVGRLPDGRVVFVPGAIPGERVCVRLSVEKDRFCEAALVDVLTPSPDRVTPDCPCYDSCGGCQARHMTYARTLELKRQKVYDALTRIGGFAEPNVLDTVGCEQPERVRNKAEYPIAFQDGRMVIGAYARGGKRVVGLKDCLLQSDRSVQGLNWLSDQLNALPAAKHLKYLVTRTNRKGELMLILCGDAPIAGELKKLSPPPSGTHSLWFCQLNRRPVHALDGKCTRIWGPAVMRERLFDLDFELSPQAFFQVNTLQTERLYELALKAAGIVPGCEKRLLDAYCGAGTITLSAARWVKHATGIEIVPEAIENARQNARINGIENARFICNDAAREIPRLLSRGEQFDTIILDPPRKGADSRLSDAIAASKIPTLTYVSCNPATLARDLKHLCDNGYALQGVQPVDMFPWTGHVETVCCLYHQKKDFISVPYEPKDASYMKTIQ